MNYNVDYSCDGCNNKCTYGRCKGIADCRLCEFQHEDWESTRCKDCGNNRVCNFRAKEVE